jgi:hypothetical protein
MKQWLKRIYNKIGVAELQRAEKETEGSGLAGPANGLMSSSSAQAWNG